MLFLLFVVVVFFVAVFVAVFVCVMWKWELAENQNHHRAERNFPSVRECD